MAEIRSRIAVEIDPSAAQSGAKATVAAANTMRQGVNAAATASEQSMKALEKAIGGAGAAMVAIDRAAKAGGKGIGDTGAQAVTARRSIDQLQGALRQAGAGFNALANAAGLVSPRLANLIAVGSRVKSSLGGVQSAFAGVGSGGTAAAGGIGATVVKLGAIGAVAGVAIGAIGAVVAGLAALKIASMAASAAWDFLKDSVLKAADFEQTKTSFEVLTGSAEVAAKAIAELKELANKTPLETKEVVNAGRSLIAFGSDVETVTETIRRLGDVSSAIDGLSLKELTDIYGKIQTSGRIQGEDINQLLGRGIPIVTELARVMGVADSEVRKLVTAGQVGFPHVEAAIQNMTNAGGKFFETMKAQSTKFNGLMSTLRSKWDELKITIGEPIANALKPALEEAIVIIDQIAEKALGLGPKLGEIAEKLTATIKIALQDEKGFDIAWEATVDTLKILMKSAFELAVDTLDQLLTQAAYSFGQKIKDAMKPDTGFLNQFAEGLKITANEVKQDLLNAANQGGLVAAAAKSRDIAGNFGTSLVMDSVIGDVIKGANGGPAPNGTLGVADKAKEAFATIQNTQSVKVLSGNIDEVIRQNEIASTKLTDVTKNRLGMGYGMLDSAIANAPQELKKVAPGIEGMSAVDDAAKKIADAVASPKAVPFETRAALAADGSGKTAAQLQSSMQSQAESVRDSIRTPYEDYSKQVTELEKLRDAGLITSSEFGKATFKAQTDYVGALENMAEAQSRLAEQNMSQLGKLMHSWGDLSTQVDSAAVASANSIASNMTTAIMDVVSGTKTAGEAFEAMAAQIINQITQIVVQLLVQYAISQTLGYALPGLGGAAKVAVRHDGSSDGSSRKRDVSPGLFAAAPRFHSGGRVGGLQPDEVPAILQTGEEVLTREDAAAMRTKVAGGSSGQGRGNQSLTILNVDDPERIKEIIANNPDVVLNVINRNAPMIKRMLT